MTAFTISSSINIDALAPKTGNQGAADTFAINAGGYLFVDQDSRFGVNQHSSSVMGNITMAAAGGVVEFNAQNVRLVSYDSASGFVPLSNVIISSSNGASGSLIGVYPNLTSSALASGSIMPAFGFLKIKRWNGISFSSGSLFGITGSSPGNDVAGWIEIVGQEASSVTVNRLNTFKVRGSWFELGATTGAGSSSYQIPNNGQNIYAPGVWVETSSGSNNFEFYSHIGSGSITSSIATDVIRGKYCWISTSGSVQFQPQTGSNTSGYLPPAGCKVRIPNVFFQNCTSTARHLNALPNATLATRYDFTTTGGGVIDIDKAVLNWYPSLAQPYSVALANTAIMTQLLVSEIAAPISWSQIGVGIEAQNSQFALSMATCFAGGTISDSVFTRANLSTAAFYVATFTDIDGFTFNNVKFTNVVNRTQANQVGAQTLLRANSCTFNNNSFIGAGGNLLTTCADVVYSGTVYTDNPNTSSFPFSPQHVFSVASTCARCTFNGLTFGSQSLVQPYGGILSVLAAGCTDIKLRNIGSPSVPLDFGDVQRDNVSWSRVTTTATVTLAGHGLKVGDQISVIQSGDITAVTVAIKTIATVPSADTFTFTCLNAGATTGTLTYFPAMTGVIATIAASAAAKEIEIKRCYSSHLRTTLYTSDNSTKDLTVENVWVDPGLAPVNASLNTTMKGIMSTVPLTVQTSIYGTHWIDMMTGYFSPVTSSVNWTRVTTTATVTSSLHNLRTGEFINVLTSSATASIVTGQKTITVTSASFFTFTCLNAGATVGTLDFENINGRIALQMNESTLDTVDVYTIDSGSPGFTSAGTLSMPTPTQQVTFTTPDYIIGYTGFYLTEAVMAGGTLTNHEVFYAIDDNDGLGYSSFRNLSYPRVGAGGSVSSQTVTMADTTGVVVGDYVFGTNIAAGAYVRTIVNSTTIGVSHANIGTVSGILRFSRLPSEVVDPTLGFKMKIKIRTITTNVAPISSLYVLARNTAASRLNQYPLDMVILSLTGLKNPSEVRVFPAGSTTSIAGSESVTSGTFTTLIDATTYPSIDIAVLSLGYQNLRLLAQQVGDGLTIPVQQVVDRQYFNS